MSEPPTPTPGRPGEEGPPCKSPTEGSCAQTGLGMLQPANSPARYDVGEHRLVVHHLGMSDWSSVGGVQERLSRLWDSRRLSWAIVHSRGRLCQKLLLYVH